MITIKRSDDIHDTLWVLINQISFDNLCGDGKTLYYKLENLIVEKIENLLDEDKIINIEDIGTYKLDGYWSFDNMYKYKLKGENK